MGDADREAAQLHNALIYARRHLKTHVEWRTHLNRGGDLPHELIGNLEHHEQAINELNTICAALRRAGADRRKALLDQEAEGA